MVTDQKKKSKFKAVVFCFSTECCCFFTKKWQLFPHLPPIYNLINTPDIKLNSATISSTNYS